MLSIISLAEEFIASCNKLSVESEGYPAAYEALEERYDEFYEHVDAHRKRQVLYHWPGTPSQQTELLDRVMKAMQTAREGNRKYRQDHLPQDPAVAYVEPWLKPCKVVA